MITLQPLDIQGHRGARGLYPENTLTAFLEAVKLGTHTLEMDVIISKDVKVVVSHEAWMNPVFCSKPNKQAVEPDAKIRYNLYNMTYEEIKQFDCGRILNPQFPFQKKIASYKPLLSEVIQAIDAHTTQHNLPPIKYNIEVKTEPVSDGIFNPDAITFVNHVYEIVKTMLDRIILQSFDVDILKAIKLKDSSITLSLLVENTDSLQANLNQLGFIPDIYGPEFILITPELISQLKVLNIKLIPWTVNEISDMKRLIEMGVDGLITDYPDRLINLVAHK